VVVEVEGSRPAERRIPVEVAQGGYAVVVVAEPR
jgi:hypothetical protein